MVLMLMLVINMEELHCILLLAKMANFFDFIIKIQIFMSREKLLLSRGANVNAQTKNGITTLHAATQKGYVNVIEALLEYNADVNCTLKVDEVCVRFCANFDSKAEYKVWQ
jgi:ankyrin repeat protein